MTVTDIPPPEDDDEEQRPQRRPAATVPHDLDAEESLLGSMLLSADAVRCGLDALDAADFYKPSHAALFRAMADLYAREKPVDQTTLAAELADRLEGVGGRRELLRIQAATPASANAAHYAEIVSQLAARRRGLAFASDVRSAAFEGDEDTLLRLARTAEDRILTPATAAEPGEDVGDLVASGDDEHAEVAWALPGLLARGEVVIITADPGAGKTTLLRQLAVQASIGRHPWNRTEFEPRRVLYLDLQDPKAHVQREFRKFLQGPGRGYPVGSGLLSVKRRQQGIDLTTARDGRWLDALCRHHRPDLLIIGPIYRAYRANEGAGKSSEEAADAVTDTLTRLMARHDFALLLEGHSPHDGAKMDYRPRGSKVWMDWPTFGFGLAPVKRRSAEVDEAGVEKSVAGKEMAPKFRLVSWRGLRDRDRPWPANLLQRGWVGGAVWPWEPPSTDESTIAETVEQAAMLEEPF